MKQLIHGGRVLTAGRLGGEPADLLIDGDTIVAVLPPGESVTDDARRIDAGNRLLIPGLVNAHTHATVHLSKAMADRWSLELLLNAYPWTAGGRTLESMPIYLQMRRMSLCDNQPWPGEPVDRRNSRRNGALPCYVAGVASR